MTHGRRYAAKRIRCPCDLCREWRTQDQRRYRARHPERDFTGWRRYNGVRPGRGNGRGYL